MNRCTASCRDSRASRMERLAMRAQVFLFLFLAAFAGLLALVVWLVLSDVRALFG